MPTLDIINIPHEVLRAPTKKIDLFDSKLHTFLEDMNETMVTASGLGLAAPQVGRSIKVAIIDLTVDGIPQPMNVDGSVFQQDHHIYKGRLELINPTVTLGAKKVSSDEGCLSIPDFRETISRSKTVTTTAFDRFGREFSFNAEELLAFAVQHEVDHLNGVLFTDYLRGLKKTLFNRWCAKNVESVD